MAAPLISLVGMPTLFIGISSSDALNAIFLTSSYGRSLNNWAPIFVSNGPGARAFTWIPWSAYATAMSFVRTVTAPFVAHIPGAFPVLLPRVAMLDDILMIFPDFCLSMILKASLQQR